MSTKSRHRLQSWTHLLIVLALVILSIILAGCANGPSAPARTTATRTAIVPTTTGPIITPNPLNRPSGSGQGSDMPTSWVHLTIGGSLSGTLMITGVAQTIQIQPGDNPYQLYFFLEDAQGPSLLLEVYNYVGTGHYPLHGEAAIGLTHDDLFLWTSSDPQLYYYMWIQNYNTACEMDVTSDSASSYGGLHEIQGSFDCSELVLHNEELTNTIACAAHFDVFVNVLI